MRSWDIPSTYTSKITALKFCIHGFSVSSEHYTNRLHICVHRRAFLDLQPPVCVLFSNSRTELAHRHYRCGVVKSATSFFLAVILNLIPVLSLVIGVSIWTALMHKVKDVRSVRVCAPFWIRDRSEFMWPRQVSNVPLGIEVQRGSGILLMWAAAVPAIFALPLYMIMCVTTSHPTLMAECSRNYL